MARLEFLFMSRTTTWGHLWKVSVYWVKYLPFWKRRRSISPDLPWSIFSPQFLSSSILSQVDWSTYSAFSLSPNHLYTCSQPGAFCLRRASFLKGVSQVEKKDWIAWGLSIDYLAACSCPILVTHSLRRRKSRGVCTRDWSLHVAFWMRRRFFKMCFGTQSNFPPCHLLNHISLILEADHIVTTIPQSPLFVSFNADRLILWVKKWNRWAWVYQVQIQVRRYF